MRIQLNRHRKVQFTITIGVFATSVGALVPGLQFEAMVIGLVTNLIWIWED